MIAPDGPVVAINHFYAREAIDPARRHEAEVDVPALARLEQVMVGRVRLVPLVDVVKRVIGADESEISERADDA
jgi:hypothetical protein